MELEPLICPQCGAPLARGAGKCEYCGTAFAGAEPVFKIDYKDFAWLISGGGAGGSGGGGGGNLLTPNRAVVYAWNDIVSEVNE